MNDYKITKYVTQFGYYCGFALIAIFAIGGFISGKFMGLIGGLFLGAFLCIPFLMFCEAAHALVTIANNTDKNKNSQH